MNFVILSSFDGKRFAISPYSVAYIAEGDLTRIHFDGGECIAVPVEFDRVVDAMMGKKGND